MGKTKKTAASKKDDNVKKISQKTIEKKKKQKQQNKKNILELSEIKNHVKPQKNISKKSQKKNKVDLVSQRKAVTAQRPRDKASTTKNSTVPAQTKGKSKTLDNKKKQKPTNKEKVRNESTRKSGKKNKKMNEPAEAKKKVQSGNSAKTTKMNKKKVKQEQKSGREAKIEKLQELKNKQEKQSKNEKERKFEAQVKFGNIKVNSPKQKLNIKKLEKILSSQPKNVPKKKENTKQQTLRERMMSKLKASRFRYLNETLYNSNSADSKKYFKDDPDAFAAYHDGYRQQVEQWSVNPLDKIIAFIKKLPKDYVVADFGCGEARLAQSVPHKVHSFDHVSLNERVTACDMAHTPLLTNGVNVVVFCLSLMGTNLNDYLKEASRVLKKDGILKIAEVESRFDKVDDFINMLKEYGFKLTWKDLSHNLFYFMDFKKDKDLTRTKKNLPQVTLKPCLYKKR